MNAKRFAIKQVIIIVAIVFAGSMSAIAQGQSKLQDQMAARITALESLLDGKHTPEKIRTFVLTQLAPAESSKREETLIRSYTQLCKHFGGAEFNTVSINEKENFWIISATDAPGGGMRMQVYFDEKPPHFITGIADTVPMLPPEEATKKGMTDSEIADLVRTLARNNASTGEFSGAVAVGNSKDMIVAVAHGMANRQYDVPNTVNTRFNMASMSKMFTAVGVCQLMQRGLVKPTDTLAMHVPEVADSYQGKVTIHQLLTHTGGTGRMFGFDELARNIRPLRTVSDVTRILINEPMLHEPGGEFSYSNSGFVWLGRLIETVTGQDYYEYMDEHVLKPAGLDRTGWYEQDTSVPDIAVGYTRVKSWGDRVGDEQRENRLLMGARGNPAGGAYSTVGDMLKFAEALRHHTLLDAKHTALMLEPKVTARGSDHYAYGFQTSTQNGITVYGHNGGFNGVGAFFYLYPATGYTVIVFSNQDAGASPVAVAVQAMIENR